MRKWLIEYDLTEELLMLAEQGKVECKNDDYLWKRTKIAIKEHLNPLYSKCCKKVYSSFTWSLIGKPLTDYRLIKKACTWWSSWL